MKAGGRGGGARRAGEERGEERGAGLAVGDVAGEEVRVDEGGGGGWRLVDRRECSVNKRRAEERVDSAHPKIIKQHLILQRNNSITPPRTAILHPREPRVPLNALLPPPPQAKHLRLPSVPIPSLIANPATPSYAQPPAKQASINIYYHPCPCFALPWSNATERNVGDGSTTEGGAVVVE